MGEFDDATLKLVTKVVKSTVQEDKKSEDSVVETVLESEVQPGAFSAYSKDLENFVFSNRCWESFKTGKQVGIWRFKLSDPADGSLIAEIGECIIKNIAVKIGKEDVKVVTITITHRFTNSQKALECAVSTHVLTTLTRDTEIFSNIEDESGEDVSEDNFTVKYSKTTAQDSEKDGNAVIEEEPVLGEETVL